MGNPGWSYEEVLPYFIKSEDNRNPYLARTAYHGTGGYLTVQEAPWRSPLSLAFLQAAGEMGYKVRDINGENQTGFMITQSTIRRGSRCSTAKVYQLNIIPSTYKDLIRIKVSGVDNFGTRIDPLIICT